MLYLTYLFTYIYYLNRYIIAHLLYPAAKSLLSSQEALLSTSTVHRMAESDMTEVTYHSTKISLVSLYLTLCNPIVGSPPVSPIPGILQARILEWVAISFSNLLYILILYKYCMFIQVALEKMIQVRECVCLLCTYFMYSFYF